MDKQRLDFLLANEEAAGYFSLNLAQARTVIKEVATVTALMR